MALAARSIAFACLALGGALTAAERPHRRPVVQWTVGDSPHFRYRFLEKLRTTKLFHAAPETGTFNHHGFLAYRQGVLFAGWDNHARDENSSGQHGMLRFSTDQGETWSDPKRLFPPLAEKAPRAEANFSNPFQTSQGFIELDGQLYAATVVDKALKEKVYRFNEVSRTRVGMLARSVARDGTLGEVFWVAETAPKPEPGFPAYPAGDPALVAKINAYFKQPANLPQLIFGPRIHPDSDDDHRMVEPTQPWRLDDGTWVRLFRDVGDGHATTRARVENSRSRRMYSAFSFDSGKTWTTPTRTNFPDACARANSGKLPDGQVYVINNAIPLSTKQGGRSMLGISLSRDGLTFDRMAVIHFVAPDKRYAGKAKSSGYQYPHSVIVGEYLWVIYSVNKEDIEAARIRLSELYALGAE